MEKLISYIETKIKPTRILKIGNPIKFHNQVFDEITNNKVDKAIEMVDNNFYLFDKCVLESIGENIASDISKYRIEYSEKELIKYIYLHLYLSLAELNFKHEAINNNTKEYIKLKDKIGTFSYLAEVRNIKNELKSYSRCIIIFPKSIKHRKIMENWKIAKELNVQLPSFSDEFRMVDRSFSLFNIQFTQKININEDKKFSVICDLISNIQNLHVKAFHTNLNPYYICKTQYREPRTYILNNYDHLSFDKINKYTFRTDIYNPYIPNSETGIVTIKDQIKGILIAVEYMYTNKTLEEIYKEFDKTFKNIDSYDDEDVYNKIICSLTI